MAAPARSALGHITLPNFSGPLDLLLQLIERRRLDITAVSLAAVADQYLAAAHALPEPDPDVLADFLVIGARLLLIKSRALLPQPPPDLAQEADDAADDLQGRLERYRAYRDAAEWIAARAEEARRSYPRGLQLRPPPPRARLAAPEVAALREAMVGLARRDREPAVVAALELEPMVTVAEKVAAIERALRGVQRLAFASVAGRTREEIVASFLAVLELARRGRLAVEQAEPFGPIHLRPLELSPGPPSA